MNARTVVLIALAVVAMVVLVAYGKEKFALGGWMGEFGQFTWLILPVFARDLGSDVSISDYEFTAATKKLVVISNKATGKRISLNESLDGLEAKVVDPPDFVTYRRELFAVVRHTTPASDGTEGFGIRSVADDGQWLVFNENDCGVTPNPNDPSNDVWTRANGFHSWKFEAAGDGYFYIRTREKCIDGSPRYLVLSDTGMVKMYDPADPDKAKWKLLVVADADLTSTIPK